MAGHRYSTLDGIRGVAALAIVLLHLDRPGFHVPRSTYTAVDLFFLISGFVIARAYDSRIPRIGICGFIRARMIRLYPMLLIGLLIVPVYFVAVFARSGLWLAAPNALLRSVGAGMLFLPSRLPSRELWEQRALFPLDMPAWSLMFEMAVNLAYALLLPWLSRQALVFIVLVSGLLLISSQIPYDGIDLGWSWPTLWWGFPRVTFSFSLGVLICRTKIPRPRIPSVFILLAVPLLFCAPPFIAVLLGFPLVLIAATRLDEKESRIMGAMGALSYPLYVVHYPLLHWIGWLFATCPPPGHWVVPATVSLVLLGAFLALKFWDQPLRRYLSGRPDRHQSEAATS